MLIGHKNHPEVIGTIGQLPVGSIDLIESIEDVEKYKNTKKYSLCYSNNFICG